MTFHSGVRDRRADLPEICEPGCRIADHRRVRNRPAPCKVQRGVISKRHSPGLLHEYLSSGYVIRTQTCKRKKCVVSCVERARDDTDFVGTL